MSRFQGQSATGAYSFSQPAPGFPTGWQPPFQGPPPIPTGVNVNAQAWNSGYWMFNPAYRHQHPPATATQVPWMASQHWAPQAQAHAQQQQQQGASYNPYKRVPRPPSAEYLATKLVDNPLGLFDMKPREQIEKEKEETGQNLTPWIWNPRGLVEDEAEEGIITADWRDNTGRKIAQEVRGPTPSRNPLTDSQPDIRYATRHSSEPPPSIYAAAAPAAPAGTGGTPTRRASTSSEHRRPHDSTPQRRHSDASSSAFVTPQQHSSSPSRSNGTQPESFTAKIDLQTTFSSRIIRTPTSSNSPSRSNSTDPSLVSRMERLNTGSGAGAPLARHASMPSSMFSSNSSSSSTIYSGSTSASSSLSDVQALSEEPGSMLSPLMIGATPKPSTRVMGRGGSGSSSLGSIPEISSPLNPETYAAQQQPSAHQVYSRGHSPSSAASSRTHSPLRASPSRSSRRSSPAVTPPQTSPQESSFSYSSHGHGAYQATRHSPLHPQAASGSRSSASQEYRSHAAPDGRSHSTPEPPRTHHQQQPQSRLSNPLPAPPVDVRYPLPNLSTAKPPPPPATYSRRLRKGFWNRRGDHLTRDGYIVYAPHGQTYPEELRDYPSEQEGYYDELKTFAAYNKDRPELPDSLPRFGQPPKRPYDSFILYQYIP